MDEGVVFALWVEDFGEGVVGCELDALELVVTDGSSTLKGTLIMRVVG
jgi:hypothetical protein